MEIFDTRYFNINKNFMSFVGLWPFQSGYRNMCTTSCLLFIIITSTFPHMYGLYLSIGVKVDQMVEHIILLIYISGIGIKMVTTMLAEKGLRRVYETIAENWKIVEDETEKNILKKYSERGRWITIGYIAYTTSPSIFITLYPLSPFVLDVIFPLNESRPAVFMLRGAYPVNQYDYYWEIYFFDLSTYLAVLLVICSVDTMFAATVEHCLGLFAIVNFTDVIESAYSMAFFFLLILTVMCCSCAALLYYLRFGDPFEHVRCNGVFIGLVMHMFYITWPGQKLSDYSSELYDDTYMNEWYQISIRAQNLFKFMRLRCIKPCQITAGGICVLNFQTFAAIMKSIMSYITIFLSLT